MWEKGKKRKGEGESDISDESDRAPPSKKTTKNDSGGTSGDIFISELSKNRRVSLRSLKGKIVVDIREFYNKDRKQLPRKKAISLPMEKWKILRDHIDEIDKAMTESA